MNWTLKTEGHLVLDGTMFAVRYDPHPDGDFMALKDNALLRRWQYLHIAKIDCINRQHELNEMGVG